MHLLSNPLITSYPNLTPVAVIDILVVAFLIYEFLIIVRGRRAAHILAGILILSFVYVAAGYLHLELLRAVLLNLAPYVPFAIIVVFQSEIRRLLSRLGRRRWLTLGGRLQRREFAEEVVLALTQLSEQRVGALVVIECDIGLRTFIESGVVLDATLSRELLLTIFHPGSALHDGAVIIQKDRLAAAACFLPLSVRPAVKAKLGTRHRAAIGVTEETDCLSVIVSEETGRMSVAAFGDIELDVDPKHIEERINEHVIQRRRSHRHRGMPLTRSAQPSLAGQTTHDPGIE
jgi:diadenylate cyclase